MLRSIRSCASVDVVLDMQVRDLRMGLEIVGRENTEMIENKRTDARLSV